MSKRLTGCGLAQCFAGLLLTCLAGCIGGGACQFQLAPEVAESCRGLPKAARAHVYVFLVDGVPFSGCGLPALRQFVLDLGFLQTYSGYAYHARSFGNEVCRIKAKDAEARIAVVGLRLGAEATSAIVEMVDGACGQVDLLVCIDPWPGPPTKSSAGRMVCVTAKNDARREGGSPPAQTGPDHGVGSQDLTQSQVTGHADPRAVLADELMMLAAGVPTRVPAGSSAPPAEETAPTPRPLLPRSSARRDEWDFLKPTYLLDSRF